MKVVMESRKCKMGVYIAINFILFLLVTVRENDTVLIYGSDYKVKEGFREGIQPHPSPFEICVGKKRIKQGDNMTLTIRGKKNDVAFKGFFIYAINSTNLTVGNFHPSPDVQLIDSAYRKKGAVRKSNFTPRERLEVTWIAPTDFVGPVRFLMSIMKTVSEIWIAELSEEVTVV